jgi:hypothetical protein
MGRESHSVYKEPCEGGHIITESHYVNGVSSENKRFVPGRAPSKDLTKLIAEGPGEKGTDGVGSKGLRGVAAMLGDHV